MPYILVKARSHYWTRGPTKVAMDYDQTLLDQLGPHVMNRGSGNPPWEINEPPYRVLTRLEQLGYRVVAMTSNIDEGHTYPNAMWTLTNSPSVSDGYQGASNFQMPTPPPKYNI